MTADPYRDLAVNIRHELRLGTPITSAGERSLTVTQLAALLVKSGHPELARLVRTC